MMKNVCTHKNGSHLSIFKIVWNDFLRLMSILSVKMPFFRVFGTISGHVKWRSLVSLGPCKNDVNVKNWSKKWKHRFFEEFYTVWIVRTTKICQKSSFFTTQKCHFFMLKNTCAHTCTQIQYTKMATILHGFGTPYFLHVPDFQYIKMTTKTHAKIWKNMSKTCHFGGHFSLFGPCFFHPKAQMTTKT